MNGSASELAIFASTGWPASLASACCASSRARAPRRSGEKYRCRKLSRGGCANLAWFCSNQLMSSAVRRLARCRHVLGQELHLLRHAALDDLVVLVQAHRQRLAVQDFLLDLVLDQTLQLLRRRRATPLRLVQQGQLRDFVERQTDLLRRRGRGPPRRHEAVETEHKRADQQEVNQRFTQQAFHGIGKRHSMRPEPRPDSASVGGRHADYGRAPGDALACSAISRAWTEGLCRRYATIASCDGNCCRTSDFISAMYSGTASQYCHSANSRAT